MYAEFNGSVTYINTYKYSIKCRVKQYSRSCCYQTSELLEYLTIQVKLIGSLDAFESFTINLS